MALAQLAVFVFSQGPSLRPAPKGWENNIHIPASARPTHAVPRVRPHRSAARLAEKLATLCASLCALFHTLSPSLYER